jgi:hypothetical protein
MPRRISESQDCTGAGQTSELGGDTGDFCARHRSASQHGAGSESGSPDFRTLREAQALLLQLGGDRAGEVEGGSGNDAASRAGGGAAEGAASSPSMPGSSLLPHEWSPDGHTSRLSPVGGSSLSRMDRMHAEDTDGAYADDEVTQRVDGSMVRRVLRERPRLAHAHGLCCAPLGCE